MLYDENGNNIPSRRAEVSFAGEPLPMLRDGAWPVPLNRAGTLAVSVPGFKSAESKQLSWAEPAETFVSLQLYEKTLPDVEEWPVEVAVVQPRQGLVVLRGAHSKTLRAGARLNFEDTANKTALRLSLSNPQGEFMLCEVLSGQEKIPPPPKGQRGVLRVVK